MLPIIIETTILEKWNWVVEYPSKSLAQEHKAANQCYLLGPIIAHQIDQIFLIGEFYWLRGHELIDIIWVQFPYISLSVFFDIPCLLYQRRSLLAGCSQRSNISIWVLFQISVSLQRIWGIVGINRLGLGVAIININIIILLLGDFFCFAIVEIAIIFFIRVIQIWRSLFNFKETLPGKQVGAKNSNIEGL